MKLQSVKDLPEYITKGELISKLYPDTSVDCAIPQNVHTALTKLNNGENPSFHVCMAYPKGAIYGYLWPTTLEGYQLLTYFNI